MESSRISLQLEILPDVFAITRLDPNAEVPVWASRSPFSAITRTAEELSIVCLQEAVPTEVQAQRDWRCLKVRGPLEFTLTGILASLANPLAEAQIAIFAVSIYDTDYLLLKESQLQRAIAVLIGYGHQFSQGTCSVNR